MAPVMYFIVYASFLLIVVNGQDNVSEQLREMKETLRQRDAMYQQQQNHISGIAENLQTLTGAMERYLTMLEGGQIETRRRMSSFQDTVMTQFGEVKELLYRTHLPKDCADIQSRGQTQSGVYTVQHDNKPLQVYCDLETDGGGWLVFQRRQDGSVDFYRNWAQYESGFGDLNTEFWLGNTYLYSLTSDGNQQLRVDMEDFEGEKRHAVYDSFTVGSPANKYVLTIGTYHGTAGDSLAYSNGAKFTTHDNDNDGSSVNCASRFHGAGWYNNCSRVNPNGLYIHTGESQDSRAIFWYHFRRHYAMKHLEMKFRPSDV